MIELIPKYLHLHNGPMKDLNSLFRKDFLKVWRKFSRRVQKTITTYFREHPGIVYLCYKMDGDEQHPYGRCIFTSGKTAITFSAAYFALASSKQLREAIIAHELAHVFRKGSGDWTIETEVEEQETRALALNWGYESPAYINDTHKAELEEKEANWRISNLSFANELESRCLSRLVNSSG